MSYAWRASPEDAWIEVPANGSVDVGDRTVSDVWIAGLDPEERIELGFVEVAETDCPAGPGLRVTGSSVEDVDGVPTRAWITEARTVAEVAVSRTVEIEQQFGARMLAGFPVPGFPGETLQLRNDTDRTNWLTLQARAEKRIGAGQGAEPCALPVRTTANATLAGLTYQDVADMMDALLDWAAGLMAHRWALKDAVKAAVDADDMAALLAVDPASGWEA